MVRRPLPLPPGSNVSSQPASKHADLPPEPVYDESAESPPPPVIPRSGRPLPPVGADGGAYESVDIKDEKVRVQVSEEFYDDFDSALPSDHLDEQEAYDEFDISSSALTAHAVNDQDSDEDYDEMLEGHPVGARALPPPPNTARALPPPPAGDAAKAPPLPGRRFLHPPRVPSPTEEDDDSSDEVYDEMQEGPPGRGGRPPPPLPDTARGLPPPPAGDAGKAPPLPPGRRALLPPRVPSPTEIYDEMEELGSQHQQAAQRDGSLLPKNYEDPDEMQDRFEGEVYQDPEEANCNTETQGHWSIPKAPALPGQISKGKLPPPPLPVQDVYEVDEGIPTLAPEVHVSRASRPALPDRPAAPKKVLPQKIDGFDPSQILQVKLKKVEHNTPNKAAQMTEQTSDFRGVLRPTPQSEEKCPPVQPLQPPVLKKKNVAPKEQNNVTPEPLKPVSQPKPPIQARQEKTEKSGVVPKKVLVSPPPVNMGSHPPALKTTVLPPPPEPNAAATPSPVKTALVRPERHLPPPPAEDSGKITEPPDPLDSYPWYHGMLGREEARDRLKSDPGDGVFLVRKSQKGSDTQPYTLVILYEGHFFNLKIRCRPKDQKIALGEEKRGEMAFSSVPSLVSYHRDHNVILIGNPGGETKLIKHPKRPD